MLDTESDDDVDEDDVSAEDASTSTSTAITASPNVDAVPVGQRSQVQMEMDVYFAEPTIKRDDNPLKWWSQNSWRFPLMAELAKVYLAPPPSSVASERLFSTAGDIITDNRSRLLPERAEQLIFLKVNMPLLGFRYE